MTSTEVNEKNQTEAYTIDPQKYDAVIFDVTGTLVDTEILHHRAYVEALSERKIGFVPFEEYLANYAGKRSRQIFEAILPDEDPQLLKNLVQRRREIYLDLIKKEKLEVTLSAIDFLHKCLEKGLKIGIVSGSRRAEIELILNTLGIQDIFQVIISKEDVEISKPDPEGILEASERLNIPLDRCVVFEDSRRGFEAARDAGVPLCFGITQFLQGPPQQPDNYRVNFIEDFRYVTIA